jgi:hypothetical protein
MKGNDALKMMGSDALRIARRAAILAVAALRDGDIEEARNTLALAQRALEDHAKLVRS